MSDFNQTWIFLDRFSENSKKSDLTKIRPVAARLFHAEEAKK